MADRKFTDEILSDEMAAILREKTPTERLNMAFEMWEFAEQLIRRVVKAEQPALTEKELDRIVARRMSHGAV